MERSVLVSACLLGLNTRYDGSTKADRRVLDYLRQHNLTPIPVCPEQLGGLPTPRQRSWFVNGDGSAVLDGNGEVINPEQSMNPAFIRGAQEVLKIARLTDCRRAILKQRSPSCGVGEIYRENLVVSGDGVTTTLLKRQQIEVISEDDLGF